MKSYIAALSFLLAGCGGDIWDGYVYPNKNDLSSHVAIGQFHTLEACRASAVGTLSLATHGNPSRGDYECGLNCKPKDGFNVCEETTQ